MFGTLMTNMLIQQRIDDRSMRIDPFDKNRLHTCHYKLTPDEIIYFESSSEEEGKHPLASNPYTLGAMEYVIVGIQERVILPNGIVGRFIPESGLIESGLILTAGKLDPGYGENNEQIRFGLFNARRREMSITRGSPIAYLQLVDISGLPTSKVDLVEYERRTWAMRRRT